MTKFLTILTLAATTLTTHANLTPAPIFGNHMVLQRDQPINIWGTASPKAKITLSFAGIDVGTIAEQDGTWKLPLPPMKANKKGQTITIKGDGDTTSYSDVLIGDVWLCSGQSNMAWTLSKCTDAETEIKNATDPLILTNKGKGWSPATTDAAAPGTSGVAFFFAQSLRKTNPDVPIGLIQRAVGGTPVEFWTPRAALENLPYAAEQLKAHKDKPAEKGKTPEQVLAGIYAGTNPGKLWRQHLEPLAGYTIAGAIWYQGERNTKAGPENAAAYADLLPTMITAWRKAWNQGDFPFYAVQLPAFAGGGETWTTVQKAQATGTTKVPNAAHIVTNDLPDDGLHPKDKKPIGQRLAQKALKK